MMIMIVVGQFFSGILILAYTSRHERSKALNTFLISKLLQTAAWILISHRTNMPGMIINASSNALLFTGVTLEQIAFLILKDSFTQNNKKIYLSLLALYSYLFFLPCWFLRSSLDSSLAWALGTFLTLSLGRFMMYFRARSCSGACSICFWPSYLLQV